MSIKRLQTGKASFPRIGILRKGAAKPANGNKPGADLEYFRFDPEDGPDKEELAAQFREIYGDEPRDIEVFLPYATPAENLEAWQEEWVAGGLVHRCDGETMVLWRNKTGGYSYTAQPCTGGCAPVGRLKVILPAMRRMAYVTVQTTSINDILTLDANLAAAHMLRGDLRGIPFILKRRPRDISTPGDNGKRVRRTKWLLSIEAKPSWVELQLAAMERAALPAGTLALPDGQHVDTETGEVIEVSPEEVDTHPEGKPEAPARWNDDEARLRKFWQAAEKHGVDVHGFLAAANVANMRDYTGTDKEAWHIVVGIAKAKQTPKEPRLLTDEERAQLDRYAVAQGLGTAYVPEALGMDTKQWMAGLDAAKKAIDRYIIGAEEPAEPPEAAQGELLEGELEAQAAG